MGHPAVFAGVALPELQLSRHEAVAGTAGHGAPDGLSTHKNTLSSHSSRN